MEICRDDILPSFRVIYEAAKWHFEVVGHLSNCQLILNESDHISMYTLILFNLLEWNWVVHGSDV